MLSQRRFCLPVLIAFMLVFSNAAVAGKDKYQDALDVFKKSRTVQPFFSRSYGYALFPTVGKAGIGIGGSYGKGKVYRGGTATGETSLAKASIGFQLGGQAFSEIIFFQDKRAYEDFTSGNFEFDAAASAVAITAGVQAKAGTEGASASGNVGSDSGVQAETKYRKGTAVFVHTKGGLMYEAAIGGQKFSFKPY